VITATAASPSSGARRFRDRCGTVLVIVRDVLVQDRAGAPAR
jgi:hypothetical protein